jgi:polyisoprenoid-binding protein YceI
MYKALKKLLSGMYCMAVLLPITSTAQAQTVLQPVESQSTIRFVIRNFGINVDGTLTGIQGEIVFDPAQPGRARFDVTMQATSIQTGNRMRDDHLRKKDYLDVERHPVIRLRSSSVIAGVEPGVFTLAGVLTIKGETRNVRIPFRAVPEGSGFRFKGDFRINRRDYGVGGSSISLSDELTIYLEVSVR